LLQYQKIALEVGNKICLGFADHSDPLSPESVHLAVMSLGFGVTVIEKHLTLARCLELEDFESALSPDEFRSFVCKLRSSYQAKGQDLSDNEEFKIPESESNYRRQVSRHVVSSRELQHGHIVTAGDILLKRTSKNSAITNPSDVIGRKTSINIPTNHSFELSNFC